jgi:Tfp pilus assembly protein PilF
MRPRAPSPIAVRLALLGLLLAGAGRARAESFADLFPARPRKATVPEEYRPHVSPGAYEALVTFRQGSTLDAARNRALHEEHLKAEEEGRYTDETEVRLIRALQREAVAALWKLASDPSASRYYLAEFTPVEERANGLKRRFGDDSPHYIDSGDDLAGLRVAVRRDPKGERDSDMSIGGIFPLRWVKRKGVVPLEPPDNLRVLVRLDRGDPFGLAGMSFSLREDPVGGVRLRPEVYTTPVGTERFRTSTRTVTSPHACMDCHGNGFRLKKSKFAGPSDFRTPGEFRTALEAMPGLKGLLEDARAKGATEADLGRAREKVLRPEAHVWGDGELRAAVLRLWDEIYHDRQSYLDDRESRLAEYHEAQGFGLLSVGEPGKALGHFDEAVRRLPKRARLYAGRGTAHAGLKDHRKAVADFEQAMCLDPVDARTYALAGWLLATSAEGGVRDAARALKYARVACELTGYADPRHLETLAAAHAEAGDFAGAVKWQRKALMSMGYAGPEGDAARARLARYEKGEAAREG